MLRLKYILSILCLFIGGFMSQRHGLFLIALFAFVLFSRCDWIEYDDTNGNCEGEIVDRGFTVPICIRYENAVTLEWDEWQDKCAEGKQEEHFKGEWTDKGACSKSMATPHCTGAPLENGGVKYVYWYNEKYALHARVKCFKMKGKYEGPLIYSTPPVDPTTPIDMNNLNSH